MAICIAVDAVTAYAPERRGTGKNLVDLYRHLAVLRPDWRFVLFHRGQGRDDPYAGVPGIAPRRVDIPGDRWNLYEEVRLPLAARLAGADVLHCPANTAPRHPLVPLVVTIHDLIPLEPEFHAPDSDRWAARVGRAARKARRILTPSAYSAERIAEAFGVPRERIVVCHWAAAAGCERVSDPDRLRAVRRRYGLSDDQPFVFGFAAGDPRKNTRRLLEAWARLSPQDRGGHALLLVGLREPALSEFRHLAGALRLDGQCFLAGFAPEEDVAALLSGARLLCYPSLSEGFGLPVLDAFQCGTPVLTSSVTSLPEVAGDAAVLVDPRDVDDLAGGLAKMLRDPALRAEFACRGRQRLRQFTWEACTARVAAMLEQILEEG